MARLDARSLWNRTPLGAVADRERAPLVVFLALTFALSATFYYLIIAARTLGAAGGLYVIALMWCPGLAALITTLASQGSVRGLGWGWGSARYQLWSIAIPMLYSVAAYAVVWLTGLGGFYEPAFARQAAGILAELGLPGLSAGSAITLAVLVTLLVGLPVNCLTALGEEIGWRGFLVPALARRTSFANTALLSGVIWAAWHYPLLLFADYNAGTPAWYALTCFTVMVVGISFVYAWMRLRSGSLWTGMFLHASHNLVVQQILDPLTADTGVTRYVIGEFGAALALAGVVAGLLFWRRAGELPGPAPGRRPRPV
jgi:membrane protease YdiL (CAAX protease family)